MSRYTRIPALRGLRGISRTVVGFHVAPVTVGTPRRRKSATTCRTGTPASRASAAVTISAAPAGLTVTPSRPKPNGRGPAGTVLAGLGLVAPGGGGPARGVPRRLVRYRAHHPGQGDAGIIGQPKRPG